MKTRLIEFSNHPRRLLAALLLALISQNVLADPTFTLVRKLTASDGAVADYLGFAVSISGDVALVGAIGKNVNQGAAYLYERHLGGSNNWALVKELTANDGASGNNFGVSVSMDGDVVVVGAWRNDVGTNSTRDEGAAYVFHRHAGGPNNWGQITKLVAADATPGDNFGVAVGVSGEVIVVGASGDDVGANANQGSAYVFERNAGGPDNWGQIKKLIAGDGAAEDYFGFSVSVSGDTIAVGAYADDVGANRDQGSAHIFERHAGGSNNWGQVKKLIASDGAAGDQFGAAISVSGEVVVAGAWLDEVGANFRQGSAYLFERHAGGSNNWGSVKKLMASDGTAYDYFGASVAVSADRVAVGARYADVGGTGAQGSAYVFERHAGGPGNWGETQKLVALDGALNDSFGTAVSVSAETILAGAYYDDGSRGSAYVFGPPGPFLPQILEYAIGRTNPVGSTATFGVLSSGAPLSYQWQKNGAALADEGRVSGVTSTNLILADVQFSDAGSYQVIVSNSAGSVTSQVALMVVQAMLITAEPRDQTNFAGTTATFGVSVEGGGLNYQWHKDSVALADGGSVSGATSSNLVLANVQTADAGRYHVLVTNAYGSFTSRVATLTVIDLGQAVEATNLVWTTGGFAMWTVQSAVTHDGVDAAQSGATSDGGESWLQTTVSGPGKVAFWWKVSCEMDYDALGFYIDGVARSYLSGEVDWEQLSFGIPAGTHTLRWRYFKDSETALGEDRAWLDQVAFLPDSGLPVVLAQPPNRRVGLGDTTTIVAGVGGATPRTYQWFKDAIAIAGATNTSLTLSNIGLADAANYHLVVSNAAGAAISSNAVLSVTTNGPIETVLLFADQPSSSPYRAALNNLGLSHQLFTDGDAFNAAVTNADPVTTLVVVGVLLPNMSLNPVGRFAEAGGRVLIQYWGMPAYSLLATSLNATVVQQLFSSLPVYDWGGSPFFAGLPTSLTVSNYYFFHGQQLQPLAGGQGVAGHSSAQTSNQAAVVIGHAGRTILNGFNLEEVSDTANAIRFAQNEIAYLSGRVVIVSPANQSARLGSNATFAVTAFSFNGPITFQWRFNGTNLPAATSSNLVITNVQLMHEGAYAVVVSDAQGSVTSSNAMLTVLIPPAFLQGPLSQSVVVGGSVTFSAQFTGYPPPFTSEWRRLTAPQTTTTFVSTATNSFFTLPAVQMSDAANYRLVLKCASGPANGIAAPQFTLTVLADADADGLPDAWETTYPTATDPALDNDGDGATNLDEYRAGTNPTNAASALRITSFVAGNPTTLGFDAVSNKTYTVQYSSTLASNSWTRLADIVARTTDRTETAIDPGAGTNRYYRVVTPRQP